MHVHITWFCPFASGTLAATESMTDDSALTVKPLKCFEEHQPQYGRPWRTRASSSMSCTCPAASTTQPVLPSRQALHLLHDRLEFAEVQLRIQAGVQTLGHDHGDDRQEQRRHADELHRQHLKPQRPIPDTKTQQRKRAVVSWGRRRTFPPRTICEALAAARTCTCAARDAVSGLEGARALIDP